MKKAVVTIVVGDKYQRIYNHVSPLNNKWMERWGWDSIIIDSIPEEFKVRYCKKNESLGLICMWYKLVIPSIVKDYDLVAFVDCDCVINPNAACLSEYEDSIPRGGFAGVQVVSFEERKLFPNWRQSFYDGLQIDGYNMAPSFPEKHINSGLLLYRPCEVWERWLELLNIDSDLNDEYRLNIFEVQAGRCFFLPECWNILWYYERVRRGWSKGTYRNKLTRIISQLFLSLTERNKIHKVLVDASIMHFAHEPQKMMLIDPADILR